MMAQKRPSLRVSDWPTPGRRNGLARCDNIAPRPIRRRIACANRETELTPNWPNRLWDKKKSKALQGLAFRFFHLEPL